MKNVLQKITGKLILCALFLLTVSGCGTDKANNRVQTLLMQQDCNILLYADGTVWESDRETGAFSQIVGLDNIIKIMDAGVATYALSETGEVYAWGENGGLMISTEESRDTVFDDPVKVTGLSDIVEMDVKNGNAFAIDADGNFYAWGLYLYSDETKDSVPGFPQEKEGLVAGVKSIFAGAGNYHYFLKEDGTVFSIMESPMDLTYVDDFIFPQTGDALSYDDAVDLREGTKYGKTLLYEMDVEGVVNIAADAYTMFIYKEDGTLWYWNSERITYHDNKRALANPETAEIVYSGCFEQVDMRVVLGLADTQDLPKIVAMCSGTENVLFLTDDGQVFASRYVTTEIRDVEYYNLANTNPNRTETTGVVKDMELKKLDFVPLDFEKVVNISTDGRDTFSLVNEEGEYWFLKADEMAEALPPAEISETEALLTADDFAIHVYDCLFERKEQFGLIQVEMHYPQFRLANENKTDVPKEIDKMNRQIFEYLMLEDYYEWQDSRYNSEVTYKISYLGNDYISIIFEGNYNEFNLEKMPSALNFDLRTGELIDLETIIAQEELWSYVSENPEAVPEGEWISCVGGREGVIEYLETCLQEKTHIYDFAITENGVKILVPQEMDDRIYYWAEVQLQNVGKTFCDIENFDDLTQTQQEQVLALAGEWEITEWSIVERGCGYNENFREEDDSTIGKKVVIREDGTLEIDGKTYEFRCESIIVYDLEMNLGLAYKTYDAYRLGESVCVVFANDAVNYRIWIEIGEDGQIYYGAPMSGGLYSMERKEN